MSSSRQLIRKALPLLKQGSSLSIRSKVPVRIRPSWREDGMLQYFEDSCKTSGIVPLSSSLSPSQKMSVEINSSETKTTSLGRNEQHIQVNIDKLESKQFDDDAMVEFEIPEKCNVDCKVDYQHIKSDDGHHVHNKNDSTADVTIESKLEGDINISCIGDIVLNKIRGYQIQLSSQQGAIFSSNVLEAKTIHVETPRRLRAKRIHATNVNVEIVQPDDETTDFHENETTPLFDPDDEGALIDISSLYVSGNGSANLHAISSKTAAVITPQRAIRVKSHHGHVNAQYQSAVAANVTNTGDNTPPSIELGGVNGSCDVIATGDSVGEIKVHFDAVSPDSISIVTASGGCTSNRSGPVVSLTLDRKVEADLRLYHGVDGGGGVGSDTDEDTIANIARSTLLEDDITALLEELAKETPQSSLLLPNQESAKNKQISVITSAFHRKESPLPNFVHGHVSNASMEPDSRFEQKMNAGKIRHESATKQALKGFQQQQEGDGGGQNDQEEEVEEHPLIVVATSSGGELIVESLSWLGAIARRYGLEEEQQYKDKDELGRTATRRGRVFDTVSEPTDRTQ